MTCFCSQDRPLIVRRIVRGRTIPHVTGATPLASPHNDPLGDHILQILVGCALLHPGQSAVFASRDLPVCFQIFQCPGLAFVQLPAGGFVDGGNRDYCDAFDWLDSNSCKRPRFTPGLPADA